MTLSPQDEQLINKGLAALQHRHQHDTKCLAYYEGRQQLQHIGLAVPAQLQSLELIVNWPRVVVDTIEERQDVKSILTPEDPALADFLRRVMDANDLDSDLCMWKRDRLVYGRGFLIVGTSDELGGVPLIHVASPRQVAVKIDRVRRQVAYAVQTYRDDSDAPDDGIVVLYTPTSTVVTQKRGGRRVMVDRDDHNLGVVPVVPSFNRRMTGEWLGHSEMSDIAGITDAAVRALTDLQLAVETNAVPKRIIVGAKRTDFASLEGWVNYLNPFLALTSENAKPFQLDAANLENFHKTVEMYGKLAASLTGFPARYFGLITTNPPAEGAIRAEEAKLVKRVERVNAEAGADLAKALRIAALLDGRQVGPGEINIAWQNPATPTFSQRADALQKLAGGKPLISREGAWDELGWDDARKQAERANFEREEMDPGYEDLAAKAM